MSSTRKHEDANEKDVHEAAEPLQSPCLGGASGRGPVGGDLSNTPPPSSNWVAAEDWFEVSFYVDWDAAKWPELSKRLDDCKHYAGIGDAPEELTGWYVDSRHIDVEPTGSKSGKGRKAVYCKWMFTFGEVLRFRILDRAKTHNTMPNVYLTIDGQACTFDHATNWYRQAVELIQALGGTIVANKLSRVDICLDMPGVPLDAFEECFDEKRYICRANAKSKYESGGISVCFGESPIKARIYDKLREVKKKADPLKMLAMRIYRWGGYDFPDEATRVEFQIRREGLKSRGVDCVQDYLDRRSSLARYLTTQWLRLTLDHVDNKNKNQSKARTLPLWQEASDKLVSWGDDTTAPLDPLPKSLVDVDQLLKQVLGVSRSAAKFQGMENLTDAELLTYIDTQLRKLLRSGASKKR